MFPAGKSMTKHKAMKNEEENRRRGCWDVVMRLGISVFSGVGIVQFSTVEQERRAMATGYNQEIGNNSGSEKKSNPCVVE